MKNKSILFSLITIVLFLQACKKEDVPTLDPSTPFTLNGTTYTPGEMGYFDFGSGYVDCGDTAISSDGNRVLIVNMSFQLSTPKPTTGSYGIFTDSTQLVTANHVEFNFYELTRSNKTLFTYDMVPPVNGTVDITNLSDKISIKWAAQTLRGIPYDTNTSVANGGYFNCNLSAATVTEP